MRNSEKIKYQQFVDRIEFPMIFFVYETKRIIAINDRGKHVLDFENRPVKYVPDSNLLKYVSRYIYNQNNNIEFDYPLDLGNGEIIHIDFEMNAIVIDNKHIVLCIFDFTDNHSFSDKLSMFAPRFFWKDKLLKLNGANYFCREDFEGSKLLFGDVDTAYEEEVAIKLNQDETLVLETKEPLWNVIQLIQYKNKASKFITLHRIPIHNKNGTLVGILGGYHLLHNKGEYESLFNWLRDERNRLAKIVVSHDGILFRIREDKDWSVEYVTSNIKNLGYTQKDFYLNKVNMKKIIVEEDLARIVHEFIKQENNKNDEIELEYRIKKADGKKIWVRGRVIYKQEDRQNNNSKKTINLVLTDISKYKMLQEELQISKDALKVKLDTIKTGDLPIRYIHFKDLFQFEEVNNTLSIISEVFNISSLITDYMGHPIGTIASKELMPEEAVRYYESKSGNAVFRDLYKKVKNGINPIHYDLQREIYIYAVPFIVAGKCMALLNLFSYRKLSPSSKEIQYFEMNIKSLCASVQRNIELIREKEHTDEVKRTLSDELEKSELYNELLTTALTEQNLYTALSTIMTKITEYMFVGDILMFRKIQGEYVYKKQMEWNTKGQENRRYTQSYEEINIEDYSEIIPYVRHMKVICYQKGEIPKCIQKPLATRKIRSMCIMLIELEEEENVILVFCNKRSDIEWPEEKVIFLRKASNIIKVILQRMVEKRKLIYLKSRIERF